MNLTGVMDGCEDPASIWVAAIIEGCVGETVAAVQAAAARDGAQVPRIREVMTRIAEDESRHASLSWRFVRWMLAEHPELRDVARNAFAEGIAQAVPNRRNEPWHLEAEAYGLLAPEAGDELARHVVRDVITPCAAALFGGQPAAEFVAMA
jgi:hypothetical protein